MLNLRQPSTLSRSKRSRLGLLLLSLILSILPTASHAAPSKHKSHKNIRTSRNALVRPSVLLPMSNDNLNRLLTSYEIKARIMKHYAAWHGVRYQFGGSSKRGVDCSAFVRIAFKEQFGLSLPRTTWELCHTGNQVANKQWQIGDLLLFKMSSNTQHVGIYIGDNQFIHASSSHGVMTSTMRDPYWINHYKEARRVLAPATNAAIKNLA